MGELERKNRERGAAGRGWLVVGKTATDKDQRSLSDPGGA